MTGPVQSTAPSAGPTATVALGFASAAHTYSHMFVLFFATVVLVLERVWQLPYAELFALSIPGAVMYGVAALPAGWLADRWSAAGMIAIFFIGTGLASILTGLATGPWQLAAGLTAIGTFAAIYHPVGVPWLIKHSRNHGRALGINGVFGSGGTAVAALLAGALADLWGWRAAFIVPGALCLGTGLIFILAMRLRLIIESEGEAAPSPPPQAADRRRAFIMLAITVVCGGLIYQLTAYAMPKIFEERLFDFAGQSVLGIGGFVSICYFVSSFTQILGGELADRISRKTLYAACQLLQVPIYAIAFATFSPALIPVAAVMVSLNLMGQPAENSLLARYTPLSWRGKVFGVKFLLTLGVSSIGLSLIPLVHAATGSLDGLFVLLGGAAGISFLAAVALPNERPTLTAGATGDD
ncbi:MAG: MFS transporter [Rhodospirillaceae bacterium]|jgi:MFS transporter, FSR family, fosmidomycin resistance protein|nr:MFS transporter [Rhodospirillaceae bacterium]